MDAVSVAVEQREDFCIFYEIYDPDWIEWMQKVFWNLYRTGIPAQTRLQNLEAIEKLTKRS